MSQGQSHDMTVSLRAVTRARSELHDARAHHVVRASSSSGERRLLAALEDYAATLERHGHPMPYRMRNELGMYRAMLNSGRRNVH